MSSNQRSIFTSTDVSLAYSVYLSLMKSPLVFIGGDGFPYSSSAELRSLPGIIHGESYITYRLDL